MKKCYECNTWKVYNEFYKDKTKKDGYESKCKSCKKIYDQQRYEKNKDHIMNRVKKYREENKKFVKLYDKQYRQRNADTISKRRKQYYQENLDKEKHYGKEYRQTENGREACYRRDVKRRSLKNNVHFKPFQRTMILNRDNWTCQCCGIKVHNNKENTPDKAHIDHIIPISKGGNSEPDNLQVLCRTCNLTKSNKIDEELIHNAKLN